MFNEKRICKVTNTAALNILFKAYSTSLATRFHTPAHSMYAGAVSKIRIKYLLVQPTFEC